MHPSLNLRKSDCSTRRQAQLRLTRSRTLRPKSLLSIRFPLLHFAPSLTRSTPAFRRLHYWDYIRTALQMSLQCFGPFSDSRASCQISCVPPSTRGSLALRYAGVGGCWAQDSLFHNSAVGCSISAYRLAQNRTSVPRIKVLIRRGNPQTLVRK
jgi:hypothetical protein